MGESIAEIRRQLKALRGEPPEPERAIDKMEKDRLEKVRLETVRLETRRLKTIEEWRRHQAETQAAIDKF